METMIKVDRVSKKFCRGLRRSIRYGLGDITRNSLGLRTRSTELRKDEFWALREIDVQVKRGEILGVIGPNGSGKSTLLKMLNGIFWPDGGCISVRGRVGALIEVGAGFHPMLSGRENIYVNGAILGMSKKEIDARFSDIVAFADIGDFLDMPVKKYSSGMFVRLGFAVAVHCDPDVLLIDEVLAVGDAGFRARCYNAITKIQRKAAVVLVSHNTHQISRLCTRLVVLDQGERVYSGTEIASGLNIYHDLFPVDSRRVETEGSRITGIEADLPMRSREYILHSGKDLCLKIQGNLNAMVNDAHLILTFLNHAMVPVAQSHSGLDGFTIGNHSGSFKIRTRLDRVNLSPGLYFLSVGIHDAISQEIYCWNYAEVRIRVHGEAGSAFSVTFPGVWENL